MRFNTAELTPWADFLRIMNNARSLSVEAGGKTHTGEFDMDIDDDGCVTIAFPALAKKRVVRPPKKKGSVSRKAVRAAVRKNPPKKASAASRSSWQSSPLAVIASTNRSVTL